MADKIIRHPSLDRADRKTALKYLLEAAQEAALPGMVAHSALLAAQKVDSTMDRESKVRRTAEYVISTYGERALEYAKRIETSASDLDFAKEVTSEVERRTTEHRAQP